MATIVRLSCDKCNGESLLPTFGGVEHARQVHAADGWTHTPETWTDDSKYLPATDVCPVCSGNNLDYYHAEPF